MAKKSVHLASVADQHPNIRGSFQLAEEVEFKVVRVEERPCHICGPLWDPTFPVGMYRQNPEDPFRPCGGCDEGISRLKIRTKVKKETPSRE